MFTLIKLFITGCVLLSFNCIFSAEKNELLFYTENYPPANYIENDKLIGASVETIKLIWKNIGEDEQRIQVLPWARGYRIAQKNPGTVLFTMSRTKERENMFKWVGPLFHARHVLIGLKSNKIDVDNLTDAKNYQIGVVRDDVAEASLLSVGFPDANLQRVSNLEQNIKKLRAGRVSFICQSEASAELLIKRSQNDGSIEIFYIAVVVNEMGNYYAFHKDTDDATIKKYQDAFDAIPLDRLAILNRYGLKP